MKMKKLILMMAIAAAGAGGCEKRPEPLKIDNALTAEEIAAGRLTPEVMWKMSRAGGSSLSPDGRTLLYQQTDYNMAENRGVTTIRVEDMDSKAVTCLTDFTSNSLSPKWSADGRHIYFLSDRGGSMQVWRMNASGGDATQITGSGDGEGVPDVEGFGVSPDGKHIWWVQTVRTADRRSSDIYKDMDKSKARIYDDLMARHWDYWDEGEYRHIFVYDLKSGATQNICKPTNFNTGKPVNDQAVMVGYDKYPVWSPDDSKIAFLSQRRAGNESDKARLFVYDCHTAEMQDLTADFDYNAQNVVWSGNDLIYFIAPIEATHQICRVAPSVGEVEVITRGDHDINAFTMAGERIAAEMCTISMATEFFEINPEDGSLAQISAINKSVYDNIRMGEVQKRWVKTTDGKQMLTWVILPPDFDPSQKYPVLLYCQGGPQSVVSQFWSYRWNFQLMAAQGYIVVAPNRRGLPSFGQEWLDQISGDYSGQNIRDYLSAIDDVAREPWADRERMGCVGASYGGYSVYFLAGCHEKRFKAFISHCGIFDFDSMYGETEELFFVNNDYGGPYWDTANATAQRSYANSPHKFVSKWDTPILIITGEKDFRIPYTQSLEAFTAARTLGIPARLVAFENEAHQVFKPQNSLVWNREFFGWLDKYVK